MVIYEKFIESVKEVQWNQETLKSLHPTFYSLEECTNQYRLLEECVDYNERVIIEAKMQKEITFCIFSRSNTFR